MSALGGAAGVMITQYMVLGLFFTTLTLGGEL